MFVEYSFVGEDSVHGIGRLCPVLQPVKGLIKIDVDFGWFGEGL